MTPKEHMKMQRKIAKETGSRTLTAPPGTDQLPLAERLRIYLKVFESGCSCTHPPVGNGKPEECTECVRAFVDAVKAAVDDEIAANPMEAMVRMVRVAAGACQACGEENGAHKEGCEPASFGATERVYTPPTTRCSECGQPTSDHTFGCPKSFPR